MTSQLCSRSAGGMIEIFLFILVAGILAHSIGASVHEGIFVGALVGPSLLHNMRFTICSRYLTMCNIVTICSQDHSMHISQQAHFS